MSKVKPIPVGYHTITPFLVVKDVGRAIEFYKRAFGAEEIMRMNAPDGQSVMHAELKMADSRFFLGCECPEGMSHSPQSLGGTAVSLYLYVEDVDTAFDRAVKAGAEVRMPITDMFWGDRYGKVADPFGHEWDLATHKEDLTPEQIRERAEEFFAQMAKK
ncbi:VOC family protein [Candidatus Poribacteria bacterium]|nr:VOC family protein [Candidatus Poribacteria bacterium]